MHRIDCCLSGFLRPSLVKFFGECDNLAVQFHQVNGVLLQLVECLHCFLLVEVLTESLDNEVIVSADVAVSRIEAGQSVDEDTCVLINGEYFERLAEQLHLDEGGDGIYA